jgi:hypothetical protein
MNMRRLFFAKHVLAVGDNETIPAWFQHAAVREKSTRDTPKRSYRFGSFAKRAAFWLYIR